MTTTCFCQPIPLVTLQIMMLTVLPLHASMSIVHRQSKEGGTPYDARLLLAKSIMGGEMESVDC
jgi:hypothetical protein